MENLKIERNARVIANDGELGTVDHVIVDPDTREVTHLVIKRDGEQWLLPASAVASTTDDRVTVRGSSTQLPQFVRFRRDDYHEIDDETARDESEQRAVQGGGPLLDAHNNEVVIGSPATRATDRAVDGYHLQRSQRAPAQGTRAPLTDETGPMDEQQTIELREEQLVPQKELREVGEVVIRKEVEETPGRLEVEAYREEVEVEHVAVGEVVREKEAPWEEDGILVVPVYEEQLVVTKRLVLREKLLVRRVGTTESRLFEEPLRRERVVVDDPSNTGLVHEQYPTGEDADPDRERDQPDQDQDHEEGGFLQKVVRKTFL